MSGSASLLIHFFAVLCTTMTKFDALWEYALEVRFSPLLKNQHSKFQLDLESVPN